MSRPPPTLNSKRFFLTFHRYITSTSPRRPTHPSHPPPRSTPRQPHPPPRSPLPRHASTTTPSSHYALFPSTLPHGPPPRGPFALDPRALRSEYLHLQSLTHPDRHAGALAAGHSALINEAYRTLQSPLLRAQHLLALRGIDVADDERVEAEDPELLDEVLEVREMIEGAEGEGEVEGLRGENERRIKACEGRVGRALEMDDLRGARGEVVRLRYWVNVREALDGWEVGKRVVLVH